MDAELVAWRERVRGCASVQLLIELQELVRRDRRCEARMLMYLAEVDERQSFLEQGYSSLFRYATAVLRMSDPQAYLRIQAARLARRYPVVLEMLAEGALNLSTLKLLDPHLTDGNHVALLERARNKTKREVELLVAEVAPRPDVPSQMRKLPERAVAPSPGLADAVVAEAPRMAASAERDSLFAATKVGAVQSSAAEVAASLHLQQAASVQNVAVCSLQMLRLQVVLRGSRWWLRALRWSARDQGASC